MIIPDATPDQTLAAVLARRAARHGDKPALLTPDGPISYRDLDERSGRMAQSAAALGLASGEPVLVMLPNVADFVVLWCALAKLGAIEVPINTAYRGAILAHVVNDSGAATLIADAGFLDRLAEVADRLPHLRRIVVRGGPVPPSLAARYEVLPFATLEQPGAQPLGAGPRHHDLMAVMYTSGTTGPSKGVMVTHAHAYHYALACVDLLALTPADVYYAPLPLFHIAGQWAVVYAALIAGATAVLVERFGVERFWDDARAHGATATFLLGAMASFLHRQPERADDAANPLAKALVVPLLPEVAAFARRFGVAVTTTYGSTEANVPIRATFDLPDNRTCGRAVNDLYEVRLVDEDDEEVPVGIAGELCVRAKLPFILMAGYWNHPEWTARAWRNLWLHTGDTMRRDAHGNLYFVDRLKDAIRRRGENISSMEVENEVLAHPAVLECAVVPVASLHTEQEILAVVVAKPGARVDPAELITFLAPRMADFMLPRYVDVVDALPKTPTGKIQKFSLRERGLSPSAWDRAAARGPSEGAKRRA